MEIKSLTVAGGGVLGSQIAFQSAFKGLDVTVWARSEESKKRVQDRFDALYSTYKEEVEKLRNVLIRATLKVFLKTQRMQQVWM